MKLSVRSRRGALAITLLIAASAVVPLASGGSAGAAACSTNIVTGSNFEIEGNLKVDGPADCIDWLTDGAGSGLRAGVLSKADAPSGTSDDAFGQGTKEDDPNPTIVNGSIPPNKSDLKFFGVFTETSGASKFLELFWTRINSPQGTVNMDFELNQKFCDPTATPTNCANNGVGVTPETPLRTVGDLLITYDLANGGTVPTISIRTWTVGSVWGPAAVLDAATAKGAINTVAIPANEADNVGAPGLSALTFGEAAINFNALFPSGGACGAFGGAYLKSRSSTAFNSEIKDFIAPERVNITNCTTLATTASGPVTIGQSITDTAHLTGATSNATGTITFNLFNNNTCTAPAVFTNTKTVNGNGDYTSDPFTPTAVGTYYWIASYSGDANNAPSTGACNDANESSVVNKTTPTIATTLSDPVIVGGTVHDSATLSGATADAGGTVTYTVYSNNTCTTSVASAGTKTMTNGVIPDSDPVTFNSAGTFYWQAVYSGDAKNNAATSVCTSEVVVIAKASPSIATTLSATSVTVPATVHDSATLSGKTADAGGTVTYTVYSNNTCTTSVASAGTKTVTNGVVPDSDGVLFSSTGTFYWQAVYSGDTNNNAASSACQSEILTVGPRSPSIATTLSATSVTVPATVHDSSALTDATSNAGGTVTYTVYSNNTCTTSVAGAGTKTVTNGVVPDSDGVLFSSTGTFYWQAVYSGDTNNNGASSACQSEILTVGPRSPSIATTLSATSATVGDTVHDSAALTDATSDAGGTVTYTVYPGLQCVTGATDAGTVTVTNGIVPDSNGLVFSVPGTYSWQAAYSGDANNNAATSSCGTETLIVGKAPSSIGTAQRLFPQDSATVTASAGGAPTGSVSFFLYAPGDSTCSGPAVYSEADVALTGGSAATSNATFFVDAGTSGTYRWVVTYGGDGTHEGSTSACGVEHFDASVINS